MTSNNKHNKHNSNLCEGLEYKDLDGMMKPTIHVDEFSSKMGDDEDIIVVSFFVRSKQAARDLVGWFEKGYDFVLDADQSPGEIKPNRYLVYLELRRRRAAARQMAELIDDLGTLTEFDSEDWMLHTNGQHQPFSEENFAAMVPLTPDDYRRIHQADLNEWRDRAGIPAQKIYATSKDMELLQSAAGIK